MFDENQIHHLLEHRDRYGNLLSPYELQSIEGFTPEKIRNLLPYIRADEGPPVSVKDLLNLSRHTVTLRFQQVLEKQTGFTVLDSAGICGAPNSRFIGSRPKIYAQYRLSSGNRLSAGITCEKDQGELFFRNKNPYDIPYYDSLLQGKLKKGFDFYSAHVFFRNSGKLSCLAVGDFKAEFGQGLTLCAGSFFNPGAGAIGIKRLAGGIRPYTSSDENHFFRGLAATISKGRLQTTAFISRKKTDARVTSLSGKPILFSAFSESGLHTTPSEIAEKDAVTETVFGGNVNYRKRGFAMGLTGMETFFNAQCVPIEEPYNLYAFAGLKNFNLGADYSWLYRNFNFFGEASMSDSPGNKDRYGYGYLNGCMISMDSRMVFSVLNRNYGKTYRNFFSQAFSQGANPSNEKGTYFGLNLAPSRHYELVCYYDQYQFPWLQYLVHSPSDGNEYGVRLEYTPSRAFTSYIRYKRKEATDESAARIERSNFRWNAAYQHSPSLRFVSRAEVTWIKKIRSMDLGSEPSGTGFLFFQDVIVKPSGSRLMFTFRYALFDSDSYDLRIYAVENDVPGSGSTPSYYYRGSRMYVLAGWDISKQITLRIKWGQTLYSDREVISVGSPSEITGNSKTEVKAEVKVRL